MKNNLIGQRFGRLVVLKDSGKRSSKHILWNCLCDCGNEKLIGGSNLKRGQTKSCGCLRDELVAERMRKLHQHQLNTIHGDDRIGQRKRLYRIWANMKNRCSNPNSKAYEWYGGRGISVCNAWQHRYPSFKKWAASTGYADNLTIDRIDNDGNYEPENCQWLTRSENMRKAWREK